MDRPKRNSLAGLPDEAMLEILARVPFRSVCRSKCVAKSWRDLIDDPLNRKRLPQTLQGFFAISRMCNLEDFFVKYSGSPLPLDIDPSLSFLTKLPETEMLYFLDSCNGLLLFERCLKSNLYEILGYIVCNPATKHWGTVPVCARFPPPKTLVLETYLAFDPAVSSHFHLIQFWKGLWNEEAPLNFKKIKKLVLSVHTYSSETGLWSDWNEQGQLEGWRRQGRLNYGCKHGQRIFVSGILHLIVLDQGRYQIVAVDVQGKTKRIITTPDAAEVRRWHDIPCIDQSQGRLHYINQHFDDDGSIPDSSEGEVKIWELQDYDRQEWVLKDTVSFLSLFGRTRTSKWDFVVIHPDRNVLFFFQKQQPVLSNRLIAYDMDRKEVSVVAVSSGSLKRRVVPYIPYFSESPALTNKN